MAGIASYMLAAASGQGHLPHFTSPRTWCMRRPAPGFDHRKALMLIGVPKEIKDNEFRVGLTPASVAELVASRPLRCCVEKSARRRIAGFPTTNMSRPAPRSSTRRRRSSRAPR